MKVIHVVNVNHVVNLKQKLNHGLVLKKVRKFN